MATLIRHRKTRIITLDAGDDLHEHCKPRDIALVPDPAGWWTYFIGEDGSVERYDIPSLPIMKRCGRPRPPRNSMRNKKPRTYA